MVAVRSAHINKAGEFDPKKWIASLGISSQQSCERLAETWRIACNKHKGTRMPVFCCGVVLRWWKSFQH